MIDIAVVLGAYNLASKVAELTGLIESIGVKIDRLSQSDLEAALRALDQAQRATTESESLLREARNRLNKALSLEKQERLAAAYLALAVTHHQLGDVENARHVLREFLDADVSPPLAGLAERIKNTSTYDLAFFMFVVGSRKGSVFDRGYEWILTQEWRDAQIEGVKAEVRAYLGLNSEPPADI